MDRLGGNLMADYKLVEGGVLKGGSTIPPDPANRDWQVYQEWLREGNTPDPLEANQEELDRKARNAAMKTATLYNQLRNATPEQVDTWVQNNINSLADAKQLLRTLSMVICVLVRERD
jgi:hypothetical protein